MQYRLPFQKNLFFRSFEINCEIKFFSNEFIFSKMSVWTCTRQFWHHCDKLFARFLNLIVILCLLHFNPSSAKFSSAHVKCIRKVVCILTSHPKNLFFLKFPVKLYNLCFFSREFIFTKISVWTCTIQLWHHCDNLFAQFLTLILIFYLLQLNSFAAKISLA